MGLKTKKDDLNNSIIERHVEKVHYQIELDDASFLDKLSLHALMNGGSIHQDEYGKKYLFYPIQREGEQEMCLLHEKDCNLKDKISYIHGESELQVRGKIFYQNNSDSKPNLDHQISREFRNFIIVDNCLIENELINSDVTQKYQKIQDKFKTPYYLINSVTSMESVDKVFLEIVNILQPPRIKTSLFSCDDLIMMFFINLIIIGIIAISLIILWYVMDAFEWDFKIYCQVLIFLGCIVAAFIAVFTVFYVITRILRNFKSLGDLLMKGIILLSGPIMIGFFIWRLVTIIHNNPLTYQRYTWYTISFVVEIPILIRLWLGMTSSNWKEGEKAKIDLFKKFRLRK